MALLIVEEIEIDCENLSCVTFKDITKAYDAITNPTGYGGINVPDISEILSVTFVITDKNSVQWVFTGSAYLPNAAGTSSICLKGSDFISAYDNETTLVFVKGDTYTLEYTLNLAASAEVAATPQDWQFPCCGDAITSNLGTNFSITEKIGCSSIDFRDTTGIYNAAVNPGGYGTPNPAYGDITSTLIKITRYDGTIINITDFIPTSANPVKNITAATLGYADGQIIPQVMTVEYFVYTAGNCRIGYKSTKVLFHCMLRNCIVAKGKSVLMNSCNNSCNNAEQKISISLMLRYEMLLLTSYTNIDCIAGEVEDLYEECLKYCGCT